jgi:hypothetical protein
MHQSHRFAVALPTIVLAPGSERAAHGVIAGRAVSVPHSGQNTAPVRLAKNHWTPDNLANSHCEACP